jgi:hypothetical protein
MGKVLICDNDGFILQASIMPIKGIYDIVCTDSEWETVKGYSLLKEDNSPRFIQCDSEDPGIVMIFTDGHYVRLTAEEEWPESYQVWIAEENAITAKEQAKNDFINNTPDWLKTYTVAEAQAWIDTNVTDLASAKTALKHVAQAIVFFRDFIRIKG